MKKVFIDGKSGTTGLRIYERLAERDDIEFICLADNERKDENARRDAINRSDITILCLPDEASVQAVSFIENPNVTVIDTSTAHRTACGWVYGFPELFTDGFERIKNSKRIAVPGCHASGFIALILPLISNGLLPPDSSLSCFSVTGYSGGGKNMISEYEANQNNPFFLAPRQYALTQQHKHLREMIKVSGLNSSPIFCPIVANFYSGMEVTIPIFKSMLNNGYELTDIKNIYRALYNSSIVHYNDDCDEEGFFSAAKYSGRDSMEISIHGNSDRFILTARYDNLGKGASGAAVECINILLETDIKKGLVI